VKFNWILSNDMDESIKRYCIDLEYQLRPKITKFLMARLEKECCGDFSCFHFDVDLVTNNIYISPSTPSHFARVIKSDFEREINSTCCS
jgi:hypothetical protein